VNNRFNNNGHFFIYIYKKGEKEKKNWVTQTQIVGVV
jgi:hypothetical protein